MAKKQDSIYYVTADSYLAAKASPHLEIFKKKDIEVLLLHDRVDEWLVQHLTEFNGKKLVSVAQIAHNPRRKAGWTIICAHPGEIRKEAAKA